MPRYEGMEDLLQRVRERLETEDPGSSAPAGAQLTADVQDRNEQYESTLEVLVLLLRDAEQLGKLMTPEQLRGLSMEQHDDLQSILGRVVRQLWGCKTTLEHMRPTE